MIVQIKDCLIYHKGAIKFEEHPYFLALRDDSATLYLDSVIDTKTQAVKKSGTWDGLHSLMNKIKKHGFDTTKPPITFIIENGTYVCKHGRHRMCILYHIYGGSLQINIGSRLNVIGIDVPDGYQKLI